MNYQNSGTWFRLAAIALIIAIVFIGPYYGKAEGITRVIGSILLIGAGYCGYKFAKLQWFS
jgi:hypothetical protein